MTMSVCEHECVIVLLNQAEHRDRGVTANSSDIPIKNKK